MKNLNLGQRLELGVRQQAENTGRSHCKRCGMTWDYVESHTTHIDGEGGMFPLCETCWQELETPENRLPYYRILFDQWVGWDMLAKIQTSPERWAEKWSRIERAVLTEE